MSKVIKGLRSRLRLRGKDSCDRGTFRKRKSFLLAHKPHAIYACSCLYSTLLHASCVYAFIRERWKYASWDQSSRPEPNQEEWSRTRALRRWFGVMKMRFIRPTSWKSLGFRTYSRDEETTRIENECHSTVGCARKIVIICVKTRRDVLKMNEKATWGTIECLFDACLMWCFHEENTSWEEAFAHVSDFALLFTGAYALQFLSINVRFESPRLELA